MTGSVSAMRTPLLARDPRRLSVKGNGFRGINGLRPTLGVGPLHLFHDPGHYAAALDAHRRPLVLGRHWRLRGGR